jgi:hypothetical protein
LINGNNVAGAKGIKILSGQDASFVEHIQILHIYDRAIETGVSTNPGGLLSAGITFRDIYITVDTPKTADTVLLAGCNEIRFGSNNKVISVQQRRNL